MYLIVGPSSARISLRTRGQRRLDSSQSQGAEDRAAAACDLLPETSSAFLASLVWMSISLRPDASEKGTLAGPAAIAVPPAEGGSAASKIRSRLFTKYVALFVAVVAIA